ncbi:MAG: AI-2E family transporter [Rhodanobacteraceae bacterium]|nr:AI-2E family transporter [Rhodanobacteraceae bacterium]MBL0042556.1 AI-2E family transporter [Xanthomonadales bacterium]MBP6077196.1 AI-2E family transporter [Xanthomonadales bacterium]MBP7622723.1 AI-2E family transporter [Xanthomonadales bacterium]
MNADQPTATASEHDWGTRMHVRTLVLTLMTALGLYLCYRMSLPFLAALAWALALAVLFTPLQAWLERKMERSLAALGAVLLIALIVVVPAVLVGQQLVQQAAQGATLVETRMATGEWRRVLATQPRLAPLAERIEQQLDLPGAAKDIASWLSSLAGTLLKGSVVQLLGICLTFYLLFFFLRDRALVLHAIRALSPLREAESDALFARVGDTIHATVYGTLAVSAVQGLLGGLMFWWLGLSAPLLWGLVMAALAVLPVLGAFVVWLPAALFLLLAGSWVKALILTLWGVLVIGTIDNLLRPILVGNRLKLHTILAFLSVIGGIVLFGPAGLILGPVTLTITTELLAIWATRARTENGSTTANEA